MAVLIAFVLTFSKPLVCYRGQTRGILIYRTRLHVSIVYQSSQHVLRSIRVCFFFWALEILGLTYRRMVFKAWFLYPNLYGVRETCLLVKRSCSLRVLIVWNESLIIICSKCRFVLTIKKKWPTYILSCWCCSSISYSIYDTFGSCALHVNHHVWIVILAKPKFELDEI
jgi:hypothetical protein